jgi:hypothetical protein
MEETINPIIERIENSFMKKPFKALSPEAQERVYQILLPRYIACKNLDIMSAFDSIIREVVSDAADGQFYENTDSMELK